MADDGALQARHASPTREERLEARRVARETMLRNEESDARATEQPASRLEETLVRTEAMLTVAVSSDSAESPNKTGAVAPGTAVVPVLQRRANLLEGKKQFRPSSTIVKLMPQGGDGLKTKVPQRKNFGEEGPEGDAAHATAMKEFSLSSFGDTAMSQGRRDANMCRVGLFGHWMTLNNYGSYVVWDLSEGSTGRKERCLVAVEASGKEKIPPEAAMMEYVLAMATSDVESRPKGGWRDYKSGSHAKLEWRRKRMVARQIVRWRSNLLSGRRRTQITMYLTYQTIWRLCYAVLTWQCLMECPMAARSTWTRSWRAL